MEMRGGEGGKKEMAKKRRQKSSPSDEGYEFWVMRFSLIEKNSFYQKAWRENKAREFFKNCFFFCE